MRLLLQVKMSTLKLKAYVTGCESGVSKSGVNWELRNLFHLTMGDHHERYELIMSYLSVSGLTSVEFFGCCHCPLQLVVLCAMLGFKMFYESITLHHTSRTQLVVRSNFNILPNY